MSNEMTPHEAMAEAVRLLRDAADELHESHNAPGETTFDGEPEAQAAYEEHERVANALESAIAARLRGDGAALSTQPAPSAPVVTKKHRDHLRQYLAHLRHPSPTQSTRPRMCDVKAAIEAALGVLSAPSEQVAASVAVPDGYALVPVRATKEMREAWDRAPSNEDDDVEWSGAYARLIAAAPVAPEREG